MVVSLVVFVQLVHAYVSMMKQPAGKMIISGRGCLWKGLSRGNSLLASFAVWWVIKRKLLGIAKTALLILQPKSETRYTTDTSHDLI